MALRRPSSQQKKFVARRAGYLCEYCRCPDSFSPQPFAIEHILPASKGGQTELDNLAFSCQGCNNHKYTKVAATDSITNTVVPFYNPRIHRWAEHFIWSDDSLLLVGISAIGRATINALHLNRNRVVNLRQLLILAGKHPPA